VVRQPDYMHLISSDINTRYLLLLNEELATMVFGNVFVLLRRDSGVTLGEVLERNSIGGDRVSDELFRLAKNNSRHMWSSLPWC
jgi:hypothetical protein